MTKIEQGGYQRDTRGRLYPRIWPSGTCQKGEGSAFEMELLTSFLENITCREKKFSLFEDIFRGDIWGSVWQLGGGGEQGGWKVRNNGHDGGGILILVQDFIRGEYYFGDSNKSE